MKMDGIGRMLMHLGQRADCQATLVDDVNSVRVRTTSSIPPPSLLLYGLDLSSSVVSSYETTLSITWRHITLVHNLVTWPIGVGNRQQSMTTSPNMSAARSPFSSALQRVTSGRLFRGKANTQQSPPRQMHATPRTGPSAGPPLTNPLNIPKW